MSPLTASDETAIALVQRDIEYIKKSIDGINTKLETYYVSNDRFEPVRNVVYGLVGVILTTVVGAVLFVILNLRTH